MNSAVLPYITEALQKIHRVLSGGLIESIDRLLQSRHRGVPAMMTHFFFERLPCSFFRVCFWLVGWKMNHPQSGMRFKPLLNFVAGMMPRPVDPQNDLAARELFQNHLQPSQGGVGVLPVNAKGRHILAGSQMQRPVDVFGLRRAASAIKGCLPTGFHLRATVPSR